MGAWLSKGLCVVAELRHQRTKLFQVGLTAPGESLGIAAGRGGGQQQAATGRHAWALSGLPPAGATGGLCSPGGGRAFGKGMEDGERGNSARLSLRHGARDGADGRRPPAFKPRPTWTRVMEILASLPSPHLGIWTERVVGRRLGTDRTFRPGVWLSWRCSAKTGGASITFHFQQNQGFKTGSTNTVPIPGATDPADARCCERKSCLEQPR